MPIDRRLSTLELTVLGVVMKRGPCTAYAVMTEFIGSPTASYRSGAGSIYPLLKRLHRAGLVSASVSGKERRYELTQEGQVALKRWFTLSDGGEDFFCSLDALRSRAYFMKCLTAEEREEFFESALKGLRGLLRQCRHQVRRYQESGDRFSELAMEGAVIETQARIRWLKKFRSEQGTL